METGTAQLVVLIVIVLIAVIAIPLLLRKSGSSSQPRESASPESKEPSPPAATEFIDTKKHSKEINMEELRKSDSSSQPKKVASPQVAMSHPPTATELIDNNKLSEIRLKEIKMKEPELMKQVGMSTDYLLANKRFVTCFICTIALLTEEEVKAKYSQGTTGLFVGSMDDLEKAEHDRDVIGVTCAICGENFCSACMMKYGKPHPNSGGLACPKCGGHMTPFKRNAI